MKSNYYPFQEKQLVQFKHAAEQLDARKAKVSSLIARRHFLTRQKNANYNNELYRLQGIYSHTNAKPQLDNRIAELKALGAKAVDTIQD